MSSETIGLPVTGEPAKLTGATAVSRYVGGVADVAPTTGSFEVGDYVVSRTGKIWTCTVAGAPGTWVQVGAGDGLPLGLTGATAATRFVGATAGDAPTTGTFAIGDFSIDRTGKIYICTVAGTPGTWVEVGSGGGGGLPSTIEHYTNATSGNGGWSAQMWTNGSDAPGTGTLWSLDNLPSNLSANSTQSITIHNTSITSTSRFFITPVFAGMFMGGPSLIIWPGGVSAGTSATFYVTNPSAGTGFAASWRLDVLMVQAT